MTRRCAVGACCLWTAKRWRFSPAAAVQPPSRRNGMAPLKGELSAKLTERFFPVTPAGIPGSAPCGIRRTAAAARQNLSTGFAGPHSGREGPTLGRACINLPFQGRLI